MYRALYGLRVHFEDRHFQFHVVGYETAVKALIKSLIGLKMSQGCFHLSSQPQPAMWWLADSSSSRTVVICTGSKWFQNALLYYIQLFCCPDIKKEAKRATMVQASSASFILIFA